MLYCHQLFVLQHHSWLSNLTKGIPHMSCRCNDSCDSVIYGRTTQTSITAVSNFPENLGGHACKNSGYQVLLFVFFCFFECLGTRLVGSYLHGNDSKLPSGVSAYQPTNQGSAHTGRTWSAPTTSPFFDYLSLYWTT